MAAKTKLEQEMSKERENFGKPLFAPAKSMEEWLKEMEKEGLPVNLPF